LEQSKGLVYRNDNRSEKARMITFHRINTNDGHDGSDGIRQERPNIVMEKEASHENGI
jgi:hypothetical protein